MSDSPLTRRDLLRLAGAGLTTALTAACAAPVTHEAAWMPVKRERKEPSPRGRLSARPSGGPTMKTPAGLQPLAFGQERDGFLYVPAAYRPDQPAPLVVMFHGASGRGRRALERLQAAADRTGLILLAPDSRGYTWDVVMDDYGPDVAFVDKTLAWTFERCAVDARMIVAEGFSDGASYALSLGLTNGDLFTHAIAFSPGFLVPAELHGSPRVFVSHGIRDQILPIDRCSRRIVPRLKDRGYDVRYIEFDGTHEVPAQMTREAVDWLLPPTHPRRPG